MKRIIKLLSLLASVAVLAVALCSCGMLDKMREKQAEWIERDKSFEHDGKVYSMIDSYPADAAAYDTVRITEPDLPVLLSGQLSKMARIDKEKGIASYNGKIFATEGAADYIESLSGEDVLESFGVYGKLKSPKGDSSYGFAAVPDELRYELKFFMQDLYAGQISNRCSDYADFKWRAKLEICDKNGYLLSGVDHALLENEAGELYIEYVASEDEYLLYAIEGRVGAELKSFLEKFE